MAATYPADTFQEGVDLTIEASNQLAQVVRGDANTEVTVADGSTIPSIRKAQADSMYFKEPEVWTTGQTETDYLQLKKYIDPTTNKESWWFAKGALVSNPIAMGTSPFGDDNWTLYTPEDLFISGKAEYESIYQALKGKAAEAGYNLVRGSFEEGGTLASSTDVLWYQANGKYYNWFNGSAKTVVAGSTPAGTGGIGAGAWVDRTDDSLRDEIREYVNQAQEEIINGKIFPESGVLSNGMTVPTGTTHLRVLVDGETAVVAMSPVVSGAVSLLTETGATINTTTVNFRSWNKSRGVPLSQIPGVVPLGKSQITSTDTLSALLDSTQAINDFISSLNRAESVTIIVDCMVSITDTIFVDNQNVNFTSGSAGIDTEGVGFKWGSGRQSDNNTKSMFRMRGWRFSKIDGMRFITPAVYAPSDPSYSANHTLKAVFDMLWRQEDGDRIGSTDTFERIYVGWYDNDAWPAQFSSREARGAKYLFLCENEPGFNNNGNNDFHVLTSVTSYQIDTFASVQNAQNLGWHIYNPQFFWGNTFLEMPAGGIHHIYDLWLGGLNGEKGVFRFGTSGSTNEISEVYVHNISAERIYCKSFIEAVGGLVKFRQTGGGRCGFSTLDTTLGYFRMLDVYQHCIATDIKFTGVQLEEDSFTGNTPDFRYRYDTNSRRHRIEFEDCRGRATTKASFEAGERQAWTVHLINKNPSTLESFLNNTSVAFPSTDYTFSYNWQPWLRDGFGRIPIETLYKIAYAQSVNALSVGETGVDANTVVDSITYRVKPAALSAFFIDNVIYPDMRVIGLSANFVYNDLSATYFKIESPDASFVFGSGISNGSQAQRYAPLKSPDSSFYQSDTDNRLKVFGFSDSRLTKPAAFSSSSDKQTFALTIHYIKLDRDYIDIDKYGLLPITQGV